jgi:peptide chain release factor 1
MAEYALLEKYESIRHRFEEVQQQITDPAIIADMKRYVKLNQEYKSLGKLLNAFKEYKSMVDTIQSGKEILDEESDEELREMAREEMEIAEERIPEMEKKIKMLLVPADPEDSKNAILEIRAGTGGDEASIFAERSPVETIVLRFDAISSMYFWYSML